MNATPLHAKLPPSTLPSLEHLGSADFERIYEPSDDTYLLVDALTADAPELRRRRPAVCIEVGSGSGCVVTHLGSLLPDAVLLAGDINRAAAAATTATAAANGVHIEALHMDLLTALRPGSVDVVIFNPPYVPTSRDELADAVANCDLSAAWAGGERGRDVLDRLLPVLGRALSSDGLFYLLGVAENDPQEIAELLLEQHGLSSQLLVERRAQNERLFVLRSSRTIASAAPGAG